MKIKKLLLVIITLSTLWITLIGFWLDGKETLSQNQIIYAFYLSAIAGLLPTLLFFMFKNKAIWKNILLSLLALLLWRITYFPIMVLAGYLATLGESLALTLFDMSVVYPFLLLSVALMNALSLLVAATVLFLVFLLFRSGEKNNRIINKWSSLSLISISIPLAVLAIGVSFTQPADWHAIPDTTYLDDKPLPAASLPEINPYSTALDKQGLSWQHKVLFKSAEITYDLIPNNTQWSQVVKGTLESEFVKTKVISTAFCTKVHLRAFMTAQPYLNGKKSINNL
ncbi:MAG: hypothetical protein L3J51_07210 [Cocleimonas sp.]|nr:hypothetical protein [Cocleimonas sp.]